MGEYREYKKAIKILKPIDNIKEQQKLMQDILKAFMAFAKIHDIKYWAAYGTLLGAVRHGEQIPWDDDVDLIVLEDGYRRLLEYSGGKSFYIDGNKRYELVFVGDDCRKMIKIYDKQTLSYFDTAHLGKKHSGIFIDIFPMIKMPKDTEKSFLRKLFILNRLNGLYSNYLRYIFFYKRYLRLFAWPFGAVYRLYINLFRRKMPAQKIVDLFNNIDEPQKGDRLMTYVYVHDGRDEIFHIDDYKKTIYKQFGDIKLPCPVNFDSQLRKSYGENYMTPVKTHSHLEGVCFWKEGFAPKT